MADAAQGMFNLIPAVVGAGILIGVTNALLPDGKNIKSLHEGAKDTFEKLHEKGESLLSKVF
jgi:phosphotransferase system  glucose/maltose/N-acetylglucosamine-specific IIC component